MKRNMKFLLLLAIFATSIMAAYFISGCGDDITEGDTIINQDNTNDTTTIVETTDRVIGTITGTVRNGWDNGFLADVTVIWTNGSTVVTTTTNANGYWTTPGDLPSGDYEFTFSRATYATTSGFDTIPDLDEVHISDPDIPVGDYLVSEVLDMWLLPTTATVKGVVYTALPAPPGKDGEAVLALDDPTLVSVAAGVTVILDYGFDIHPDKYTTTTDAFGAYSFTAVPLWTGEMGGEAGKDGQPVMALADNWEVDLMTLPFPADAPTHEGTMQSDIEMVPGTTVMPNVFAPLIGGNQTVTNRPVILTYTFDTPGFMVTDDLVINFSKPMDTATVRRAPIGFTEEFNYSWSGGNMMLTINPALSLVPDNNYDVSISGKATDGLWLLDTRNEDGDDNDTTWQRTLVTQSGIRFVSTNLDEYGDAENPFTDFPLDSSITLTFDMDVDLSNANGKVKLLDFSNFSREVDALVTASGVTVTVSPTNDLKTNNIYELDFRIYSNLRGDTVGDAEVTGDTLRFTTVNTIGAPIAPTDFDTLTSNFVADFDETDVDFKWSHVTDAEWYLIYAKDNHANTDLVVVSDTIYDFDYLTIQGGAVDLSTAANLVFDLFDEDAIQTPFSDSNVISFQLVAGNDAGVSGFSTPAITIADKQGPTVAVTQVGIADNAARGIDTTFALNFAGMEYLDSVEFVFTEAGGDPAYVLTGSDVTWAWGNDMRNLAAYVTIPAGKTGSADLLTVNVWDNSGNMGWDTLSLTPWIVVDSPHVASLDFMAPNYTVRWTSTDPNDEYDWLNIWFSLDGGSTWFDSIMATADDGNENYTVDDTLYSTTAMVGIQDTTAGGGWMWKSDVFTWTGINLTAPDSAIWDTMTVVYDEGGVDSTGVPITFGSAGLDSVVVVYSFSGTPGTYTNISDTIEPVGGSTNYTWYPDDIGGDYNCYLGIKDLDGAQPIQVFLWDFPVIHDFVSSLTPTASELVAGGEAAYDITWDTTVVNMYDPYLLTGKVRLEYTVDSGATWLSIIDSTGNDGTHSWAVPATTYSNDSSWIRISDKFGLNVLDTSRTFTISGIVVDSPAAGMEWLVGTGRNIRWHDVGNVGNITIYWSNDGFVSDSGLVVANHGGGSPFAWSVPANSASATVSFRLFGNTDAVYATSPVMTFSGVIVTSPVTGNLAQGAGTSITWTTVGTLVGATVDIEYKYITTGPPPATSTWLPLATGTANDGSWTWDPIPAPPAEQAWVKVMKAGAPTGSFQGGEFSISGLVVVAPNGGESWAVGSTNNIEWNVINPTDVGNITIALYKDPGGALISTLATGVDGVLETWSWNVPPTLTVSAFYYIKIFADAEPTITDVSDAYFDVPLDVTVTTPNGGEVLVSGTPGTPYDITWTDNGVVDPVQIEYTVNNGANWYVINGAGAIAAGTNTFTWNVDTSVDTDIAASVNCKVRVTTTAGPAATDESDLVFEIQ